jgi:transposase
MMRHTAEKVIVRKQLRRGQVIAFFEALAPCHIGMEACATSHHWARELTKLGHEVRLMPAKDVKAYVKRNKNDAADAEAICEAVRRPTMRFVRIKSAEQQGLLMLHRARDLLMRQGFGLEVDGRMKGVFPTQEEAQKSAEILKARYPFASGQGV